MSTVPDSPSDAEAGAEEARADLVGTLNQLRENLKPANVVEEVMTTAKVNASAITDQIWDAARRNPLPALMIGAGLAMILGLGGRAAVARQGRGDMARPRPRPSSPNGGTSDLGPEFTSHISRSNGTSTSRGAGSLRDTATGMLDTANDRLSAAASRGVGAVSRVFRNSPRAGGAMTSYSRDELTRTISNVFEEQPLVLAAIGIAVGAAIGAAIPQTETENSLMGQTSGSVRDAAQDLVHQEARQLRSAAEHAVQDIKQTVADHGVNADNLSGLVRDVTEKTKAATYEAGRTLDPTT